MQGEPKWFNTKQDLENWRAICEQAGTPENYQATIRKLYDSRMIWVSLGTVPDTETGITDNTHRVIENIDFETQAPVKIQQALQVDENAWIYRLGYIDAEIEAELA